MPSRGSAHPAAAPVRHAAVAGSFYPAAADRLRAMVRGQLDAAASLPGVRADRAPGLPLGLLVPHAGLVYSGVTAAAAWSRLAGRADPDGDPPTVVILGTNHGAAWLTGVAAWEGGSWGTPLGHAVVDEDLATDVVGLGPPFLVDREAHAGEHSIEVQLPLLAVVAPGARIVPLSVAAGTGLGAIEAGRALGDLLARRRATGSRLVLAISSDMAHYPAAGACADATVRLLPSILALDAARLAGTEEAIRSAGIRGLVCGMCGIEPAVVGLAALRAAGATTAVSLAAATSADAGGAGDRTVGYLAVRFDP